MEKLFVAEQDQIYDGFRLGERIYSSGFRPTFIVGLWRGGSVVGMVVQECLATLGVEADHMSLRTSYAGREAYEQQALSAAPIHVHGKQYLLEHLNAADRLLIVDDVYSSGRHVNAVLHQLRLGLKRNMPTQVRVAALWFRPGRPGASRPDYYLHETDQWLVLPYEMKGLSVAEIRDHKPFLVSMLELDG